MWCRVLSPCADVERAVFILLPPAWVAVHGTGEVLGPGTARVIGGTCPRKWRPNESASDCLGFGLLDRKPSFRTRHNSCIEF